MQIDAEWSDDCGGKRDYDADLISISSRCYPGTPQTAVSSLILWEKNASVGITLTEENFQGTTREEVEHKVEKWAQARFEEIVELLKTKFQINGARTER